MRRPRALNSPASRVVPVSILGAQGAAHAAMVAVLQTRAARQRAWRRGPRAPPPTRGLSEPLPCYDLRCQRPCVQRVRPAPHPGLRAPRTETCSGQAEPIRPYLEVQTFP